MGRSRGSRGMGIQRMAIEKNIESGCSTKGIIRIMSHSGEMIGQTPQEFDMYCLSRYEHAVNRAAIEKMHAHRIGDGEFACRVFDNSLSIQLSDFYREIENAKVADNVYHNVTCTVGRVEIAKAIANDSPGATYLEYCALGTNAAAATVAGTTLGTEIARKLLTTLTRSSTTVTARTFFTSSEAIGTLLEVGHFLDDATGAADSGTLFDHSAISEVKTSSITLTIVFTLLISDA